MDALVHRFAGPRGRSCTVVALDMGRPHRSRAGRRGARLAQQPLAAPDRIAGGGAAVPAQCRGGAEPLGRLLPDGSGRLERVDRRPAAGRDRSGQRHGDAGQGCSRARGARSGDHPRRRIALQTPHRARVSPTGVVRHECAQAAGGHDDRRRVQHPVGLAAHRQRDSHHRQLRRSARRQRAGVRLRRRGWVVQQRHRMRQRSPRQRGRPSHQGRAALRGVHLRSPDTPTGGSWAGRWGARALWT